MTKALPKRQAVPVEETWDTSLIYATLEDYKEALANFDGATAAFEETYKDQLHRMDRVLDALPVYEALIRESSSLSYYAFLNLDVDKLNEARAEEANLFSQVYEKAYPRLAFLETELMSLDESYLDELAQGRPIYRPFLEELKRQKKHQLSTEQEELLSQLRPVFGHPSTIYSAAKFEDMVFDDFEVNGKTYANSYVLFENDYEFSHDTGIRRAAADSFYNTLRRYKNVTAQAYLSKIKNEQLEARLRGFDSTIDYLLHRQNVSRDLMDRQIDVIMSDLAPHMRRFVKLVADQHGLDKITSADLKLGLDSSYNVRITPEESRQLLKDSLAVLGEEYGQMIDRAFDERWIDFAQNEGKSTGGYCATLYQGPSYILLSWTGLMNEVLVLAHELGHAGHFQLASKQSILNYDPSLYFIEAPSTANEVLTCNQLLKNNPDPAFQAYLISELISRTYFHNMVTHLLEAAFQREVYTRLDNNEFLNGDKLCQIKRQVIQEFWGDDFEITEDAGLIWMRQPHYYSGLYPYTYSAGLTIGTVMAQQLEKEPETTVAKWLETLELGASLSAQDLALHAGVDVTTDEPLRQTIAYVGSLVDRLEELLA
ncbi:oligoendopeptidase F [Streptococcus rupicaprae]|uniref:Oligoendopeptidase F n=1 Tax=Streptococcus rupicaprae TaxID=759619 RepID=A0ABV2FGM5_9STRE